MTRDELRSLVDEISVRRADPDGVMEAIDAYVADERANAKLEALQMALGHVDDLWSENQIRKEIHRLRQELGT